MKLGLTTLLVAALAAVLLVPTVGAKPGNGKGNGGGPPAWAGGAKGAEAREKKPGLAVKEARKAEHETRKAERAATKAERAAAKAEKAAEKTERRAARREAREEKVKPANPARTCRLERGLIGAEAFAEAYGTNENKANAFGKCVSEQAQARGAEEPSEGEDGTGEEQPAESEAEDAGDDEAEEEEEVDDDETSDDETSITAFLRYLWPFI